MSPTAARQIALAEGLIHREVGEEVFVLMPDGAIHWLKNATAVALWGVVLAGGTDGVHEDTLADALVAGFEVDRARADADTTSFVDHLVDLGVARIARPSTGAGAD